MSVTTKVYANMLAVSYGKRLDSERLRRIVEAKNVAEAFKMLGDYGFNYTDGMSVDGFIVDETNRLIEFVGDVSPSGRLAEALNARFKYNNAKLAYKSRFTEVPSDGYYATDLDVSKIVKGDYEDADKYMTAALEELDGAEEKKPQAIDLCLTRAMYKYVLSRGGSLVKKYFRAEIDMKNILSAARMKRLNLSGDEFIDGGKISKQKLEEAVSADNFAEAFEHTPYEEYAAEIERGELKELWRAERDADDYLYFLTSGIVTNYTSFEPFLNYYTEALIELKTVKTALVCIKTNARGSFYERIPKLYKA